MGSQRVHQGASVNSPKERSLLEEHHHRSEGISGSKTRDLFHYKCRFASLEVQVSSNRAVAERG